MTFFNERVTYDKLGYKKFPSFSSLSQKKKKKRKEFQEMCKTGRKCFGNEWSILAK